MKSQLRVKIFILSAITIITHIALIPIGMTLHNMEWSTFLNVADKFREGYRSAFPFQQTDYGGLTLTALRAVFTAVWDRMDHSLWGHEQGHMVFSYIVSPLLMTASAFYLLRSYCSEKAAFAVGAVLACGLQYWVYLYGNEFYPFYLICSFVFLGMRASYSRPLHEMPLSKLFLAAVLCGQACYGSRAAQIFVIAFALPFGALKSQFKNICAFEKENKTNRFLIITGWIFSALFLFLDFFGRDLGTINGRNVKSDAKLNLKIAVVLFAIFFIRKNLSTIKSHLKNYAVFILGYFIGLLPELLHWIPKGKLFAPKIFASYEFTESMKIAGYLPNAIRELVTGNLTYREIPYGDKSIDQLLALLVFLIACGFFIKAIRKSEKLYPIAFTALVSLLAYTRMHPHTTEIAPSRYLLTLMPFVVISLGTLWDEGMAMKGFKKAVPVLLILFASHHLMARARFIHWAHTSDYLNNQRKIVLTFRDAGIRIVGSEDFWFSNNLALMANYNPMFWGHYHEWGPFDAREAIFTADKAGILLKKKPGRPYPSSTVELEFKKWNLTPLTAIGDYELYFGTAVK